MSAIDRASIQELVRKVISELDGDARENFTDSSGPIYDSVDKAVHDSGIAQKIWIRIPKDTKEKIIEALRRSLHQYAEEFSKRSLHETGMGRLEDKIAKHHNAADSTPGIEDIQTRSWMGDKGTVIEELAPYGIIGAVTPSTHPIPVLFNSMLITIAGGNSVVFSVHPAAKNVSIYAVELFNKVIIENGGPASLVSMIREPSLENVNMLFNNKDINLLVATGGPAVVEAAFKAGKKVIAAGPGNPPVLVDSTACLKSAAENIITGASFDNNILCIAEKETFVVDAVFDSFVGEMKKCGAVYLNPRQIEQLTDKSLSKNESGEYVGTKDFIGKNANVLAAACGLSLSNETRLLFGEVSADHPFVNAEQMMPFMPLVRVSSFEEGISECVKSEGGYGHTAMIHTNSLENISKYSRALDTSIVVVNGPSLSGNGPNAGEGYFSHTIASPTGEGVCTPRDFLRVRRISLNKSLKIV